MNDSAGNTNTTDPTRTITLDNVVPVVTLTSLNASENTLALTITIAEAGSGINGICTVADRSGASVSGSGTTSQTLNEAGLSCGTSYAYTVTCTDYASHSGVSTATSFETSACPGGYASGGGGGGSAYTWTNTYSLSGEQFKAGYTREIKVKNRIKVKVGSIYHHIGVKELTANTATIEIASEPVEVKLNVGEDAKVDVNNDSIYDIYVKLLGIVSNQANVFVQEISEAVPEGEQEPVETTGEIITEEESEVISEPEKKDLIWLWVLIVILILAAVIGGRVAAKKRKSAKKRK